MIKFTKLIFICSIFSLMACSQLLEPVQIETISKKNDIKSSQQEDFEINIETLTLEKANKLKFSDYNRQIMVGGNGKKANIYDENQYLMSTLPPKSETKEYLLGVGDELTFVQLQTIPSSLSSLSNNSEILPTMLKTDEEQLIKSVGRVGTDGGVLLLKLGRIEAINRSISDIRSDVRNILIRKGQSTNFQLELTDFQSRMAYVFTPETQSGVVPITNRPLSLRELVASKGYSPIAGVVNMITLKRGGKSFKLDSEFLFQENRPEIFIENKDQIIINAYPYKPGQVYTISGSNSAQIVPISPEKRETMADLLFLKDGPLSNTHSKRSEVYLLRGQNPITAYHLDTQNVARILIAAKMELRPNDILFSSERPIISINRLLMEFTPLRFLIRDLGDGELF
jgi:polysaccharide biosynthesis/export protein